MGSCTRLGKQCVRFQSKRASVKPEAIYGVVILYRR